MEVDYFPIAGFLAGLKPVDILSVSDWADKYRYLDEKTAAEPGPWRTSRVPYLREIQDALTTGNGIRRVVVMKGAQLGLTEAGNNWVGYTIHIDPSAMLLVMPTESTMKKNSEIRIGPMIDSSPVLREKVAPARSRDSGNKMLQKDFPGGILVMVGANAGAGLRSLPAKKVYLDEADGYPANVEGEGSPIKLAEARQRTFRDRKLYIISTPKIKGSSVIEKEFINSDQRFFFVPCPLCGALQTLTWAQVKWAKDVPDIRKPDTAYYECLHCKGQIHEKDKEEMLAAGQWQITKPENVSDESVGFHINSLYSPFFEWRDIVKLWLDAQGKTEDLIAFINTVLGETWEEEGEAPDWQILYNRREEFNGEKRVPNPVGLITAGADIQKDRIEVEIVGWGERNESWSLGYEVLPGDPEKPEVWALLADLLDRVYTRQDGHKMKIRTLAVDTGYLAAEVYTFAAGYGPDHVAPIKGQDAQMTTISAPQAVQKRMSGKRAGTVRLINIGVSVLKGELYGWLKRRIDADTGVIPVGYCHFPTLYAQHYFKMLTAEKKTYKANSRGFGKYEWVKTFERNEALDCRVYARAAALIAGIDQLGPVWWKESVGTTIAPEFESENRVKKAIRKAIAATPGLNTTPGEYFAGVAEAAVALHEDLTALVAGPPEPAPEPAPAPRKPNPISKRGSFWGNRS